MEEQQQEIEGDIEIGCESESEYLSRMFQNVFILCRNEILINLRVEDIKNLKLTCSYLSNECNDYLYNVRDVKVNIAQGNREILWKNDAKYIFRKASGLFLKSMYGHHQFLIIPNQYLNISKLIISFAVGSDMETFDFIFKQLPNLNYFGYLYTLQTLHERCWNTLECYTNLETLELGIDSNIKLHIHINILPLCRFLKRHKNIKNLRTKYSVLRFLASELYSLNISFDHLYIDCNVMYSIYTNTVDYNFKKFFEKNLYKNLYIQFTSLTNSCDKYYSRLQYIPGIKKIHSFKTGPLKNGKIETTIPYINDINHELTMVVYNKSEWFSLNNIE